MSSTPKIKTIRIRETGNSDTYKMVIVVQGDLDNLVDKVDATITAQGESPAPTKSAVACKFKAQNPNNDNKRYVNATLTFTSNALNAAYTVTATMKNAAGAVIGTAVTRTNVFVEDGAGDEDDEPIAINLPKIKTIRIRETGNGDTYKMIVVVQDDPENLVDNVKAIIVAEGGSPPPTSSDVLCDFKNQNPDNDNKRYVNKTLNFASNATNASYQVSATMKNAAGTTIGESVLFPNILVEETIIPYNVPKIKNIRIRESGNADSYRIVVVVQDDEEDQVDNVETVVAAQGESPAPVVPNLICEFRNQNPNNDNKRYINKTLTFVSNALNFPYTVTSTMKNAAGNTVGLPVVRPDVFVESTSDEDIPVVTNIRVTQAPDGTYNVSVSVENNEDNEVNGVSVSLTIPDGENNPNYPVPGRAVTCSYVSNTLFSNLGGMQFTGGNALGYSYVAKAIIDGGVGVPLTQTITVVAE
jgi:hypothetical protein